MMLQNNWGAITQSGLSLIVLHLHVHIINKASAVHQCFSRTEALPNALRFGHMHEGLVYLLTVINNIRSVVNVIALLLLAFRINFEHTYSHPKWV